MMRALLLVILLVFSHFVFAADEPTLLGGSVDWDNYELRMEKLKTSNIPSWSPTYIKAVNEFYSQPAMHQLPVNQDKKRYNTLFIDAFWGPFANPFVKLPRPAKVFVYIGDVTTTATYMALVVQSEGNRNYYLIDGAKNPILLIEWMNNIKAATQPATVKFTVCNGYGNYNFDTCTGRGYQSEVKYGLNTANKAASMKLDADNAPSAYRAPNEDWRQHVAKRALLLGAQATSGTIVETSVYWNDEVERNKVLNTAAGWRGYKYLKANFEKLRNLRYFNDDKKDGFLRRISWLYPDDGCWTRASAVINHLFGTTNNGINKYLRPSKVFAFGNLCANTPNHKKGRVTWWYHTAPLVRELVSKKTYVLDPSIDPAKPLTIEEWVAAISATTGACSGSANVKVETINVCTGFGAGPYDICAGEGGASYTNEATNALQQLSYLSYERKRQVDLGRDADKVLGDSPPWM